MGDFVKIEKQGRVAILTMNRPDTLNAFGEVEDCQDMVAALTEIDADPGISAAILTGAGRAFCSGGNLQGMKDRNGIGRLDHPTTTRTNYSRGLQQMPRAFRALEVPIIAAINGHAIGLGNDVGCMCDIRIASSKAKFSAGFIKMGLIPGDGGAWLLQRVVGYSKAAELILTGDTISAEEAMECGLVSRVVEPDKLLDTALAMAERIAANPARSLRMAKRLLLSAQEASQDAVLDLSAALQAIAHETGDHEEAIDAFLEKRAPNFTGE